MTRAPRWLLAAAVMLAWSAVVYAADEGWYAPKEEDFKPAYMADAANMQRQTWEQYWKSVQQFYQGNQSSVKKDPGWTSRVSKMAEGVKDAAARQEVQQMFNDLGKRIAAEFAKDPDHRKISYAELLQWTDSALEAAEDSTGAELKKSIQEIGKKVDAKLK